MAMVYQPWPQQVATVSVAKETSFGDSCYMMLALLLLLMALLPPVVVAAVITDTNTNSILFAQMYFSMFATQIN